MRVSVVASLGDMPREELHGLREEICLALLNVVPCFFSCYSYFIWDLVTPFQTAVQEKERVMLMLKWLYLYRQSTGNNPEVIQEVRIASQPGRACL